MWIITNMLIVPSSLAKISSVRTLRNIPINQSRAFLGTRQFKQIRGIGVGGLQFSFCLFPIHIISMGWRKHRKGVLTDEGRWTKRRACRLRLEITRKSPNGETWFECSQTLSWHPLSQDPSGCYLGASENYQNPPRLNITRIWKANTSWTKHFSVIFPHRNQWYLFVEHSKA